MQLTLYEFAPTRSARVRWTLQEAGLDFESVSGRDLIRSEELKKIHPMGKLPAVLVDGRPLFESAAIATYIADQVPEKELIAKPGTWYRALHNQWTCFCLTEMEAWLWSTAQNTFVLPEEERIAAVVEQNAQLLRQSAAVVDGVLADADYLVDNRFSVTDIIMSFTVNWARREGLIEGFDNLQAYLDRLFDRPHCTLDSS